MSWFVDTYWVKGKAALRNDFMPLLAVVWGIYFLAVLMLLETLDEGFLLVTLFSLASYTLLNWVENWEIALEVESAILEGDIEYEGLCLCKFFLIWLNSVWVTG